MRKMRKRPSGVDRQRRFHTDRKVKRKAALALSASVLSFNSGSISASGPGQPVTSIILTPNAANEQVDIRAPASQLSVSDEFKEALIEEEGVREVVYRDVAGYPTVGVGHLITPKDNLRVGQRISYDRILELLDQDLKIAEQGVARLVGDLPLYQHEFDALVDLVFNVGEGNVSPAKSPRLNAAIDAGDYQAIADELDYRTAAGKVARGLVYRSERRANMFMSAEYENPREAA